MKNLMNEAFKTMKTKVRSIKGWRMLFALVLVAAFAALTVSLSPQVASADGGDQHGDHHDVTVVATINGAGKSNMTDVKGSSVFGVEVKLLSDGSATGEFFCVDLPDSPPGYPGIIWGKVISWSTDPDGTIVLNVIGKFHPIPNPGHIMVSLPFRVKIQKFGGAGVGHWTLDVPDGHGGWNTVCFEILTSGKLVIRHDD